MSDAFNPFKAPPLSRRGARIIAAARQIMAEFGLDGITRKRVAERAGLKPAEVSHEFHNREALMRAASDLFGESEPDGVV